MKHLLYTSLQRGSRGDLFAQVACANNSLSEPACRLAWLFQVVVNKKKRELMTKQRLEAREGENANPVWPSH